MFLERIHRRNPALVEAATELHQAGRIPANSWAIDLDVIAENASLLAEAATRNDLRTYVMTKQFARNPLVSLVAMEGGLGPAVAVDVQGAKTLHRYGVPVGHVGHLNQIPRHEVAAVLAMRPEVVTVFGYEMAEAISEEAKRSGRTQDLLLRIVGPDDIFFEGQEGGIAEADLPSVARAIAALPAVRINGTVSFPCIRYNPTRDIPVEPTPNFHTIVRAADVLRELGHPVTQINAPGNTSAATMELIAAIGGTHAEPGHGLLGTTPNHAFVDGLPERPAYVYVSEVSHFVGDRAYCFGGGFWSDIYDPAFRTNALVGHNPRTIGEHRVETVPQKPIIDYHGVLVTRDGVSVGDTVIFGFRTQMQMTRSQVVVLAGVQQGAPEVAGLFDHAGTLMDEDRIPVGMAEARASFERTLRRYAR